MKNEAQIRYGQKNTHTGHRRALLAENKGIPVRRHDRKTIEKRAKFNPRSSGLRPCYSKTGRQDRQQGTRPNDLILFDMNPEHLRCGTKIRTAKGWFLVERIWLKGGLTYRIEVRRGESVKTVDAVELAKHVLEVEIDS